MFTFDQIEETGSSANFLGPDNVPLAKRVGPRGRLQKSFSSFEVFTHYQVRGHSNHTERFTDLGKIKFVMVVRLKAGADFC